MLLSDEDFAFWHKRRNAVEFLSEVGTARLDGYMTDCFFVDLDPKNGYSLDALKFVATLVIRKLQDHSWGTEDVQINWTGSKGFHIIARFKDGAMRPVEEVKRELESMLADICNDQDRFLKDQPILAEPFVILDLSPVMRRGLSRNAFSLNAKSGNVCVPVDVERLEKFNPDIEANPQFVMDIMDTVMEIIGDESELETMGYNQIRELYLQRLRDRLDEIPAHTTEADAVGSLELQTSL